MEVGRGGGGGNKITVAEIAVATAGKNELI